jgi:hypothetical protein
MTVPILWWKGEDNTTESQAGLETTWATTPKYSDGKVGRCFNIDHSYPGSDTIVVENNALFNFVPSGDFSIRFWIKLINPLTTGNVYPIKKGDSSGGIADWGIGFYGGFFEYVYNGVTWSFDTAEINDSEWHDVLFTYSNGYIHFYLDGIDCNEDDTYQRLCLNNSSHLKIGYVFTRDFNFCIDEIRIYNDVITPDNNDIATKTHTVIIESGLIKSWGIVDGGTLPATPNTHEVVIEKGLIKEWNISSGGTRPTPAKTHVIDTLKGLVQSWAIT